MHPARSRAAGVLSLLLPLAAAACAAPGRGTTPTGAPAALPVAAYDYFRAMDYGRPLAPNEVKGRNTCDPVDRRRRGVLGLHGPVQLRQHRPAEDPRQPAPPLPLPLLRPDERAGLPPGDGARPLRALARHRGRHRGPLLRQGLPRGLPEGAVRPGLRLLVRRPGPAAVPEPGLRRRRQGALGRQALRGRPGLLPRPEPGAPLPGRDDLRLLPHRPAPRPPAGRHRAAGVRQHVGADRQPVLVAEPHLHLRPGAGELHLRAAGLRAAGDGRHLVRLQRHGQQPADHQRDLQRRRAADNGHAGAPRRAQPAAARHRPGHRRSRTS